MTPAGHTIACLYDPPLPAPHQAQACPACSRVRRVSILLDPRPRGVV